MKGQYESRTRFMLPRRTYTIIRVDGKAFHSFTRGLARPFDGAFAECMDQVALWLCTESQGAAFAYVQSDEVSVLLTDFATPTTDAWFDGNLQKICSVSASIATAAFNEAARLALRHKGPAFFDARVFVIPDPVEVENYFIWRQKDAERNSLSSVCQKHFSHKELHHKGTKEQHDMLHGIGVNWNDYGAYWKRGRCAVYDADAGGWFVDADIPIFTQERDYLTTKVSRQWMENATATATQGTT
jgi:tRNA(His) guanylyltransferase